MPRMPEKEPEINQEPLARLESLNKRLEPLLAELPNLESHVRENPNSKEAARYSDLVDLKNAISGWLYLIHQKGQLPQDANPEKIIGDLEIELEKLEKST
ncbi:MAG: hypothetical protein HY396_02430 [Candidatus Doudnabacteria bacterium]|nr:hypothetical protein [Candidatus Doudnabacteria bacterium]